MSWARVLSSAAATVAVAGCVAVAVGMSRQGESDTAADRALHASTHAPIPAIKTFDHGPTAPATTHIAIVAPVTTAAPGSVAVPRSIAPRTTAAPVVAATTAPAPVSSAARPTAARVVTVPRSTARPATSHTSAPAVTHTATVTGVSLPLHYSTGNATRVITVTARSTGSTVAILRAWTKVAGGRWKAASVPITAHIGSDGMSANASESRSATPMGSFTLTQAFGSYHNPGTGLPYFTTTPADYWMSDEGKYYNTHQWCPSSNSGCHADGVNERLYYEQPYYRYAVVIDYNTRNAPGGVRAGRGSAFFLHVTDGRPTAGCVSIAQSKLVQIMRWLTPSAHPRILIGTS